MKDGFRDIIGKRIAAVVVAENKRSSPSHQVFLVFSDGTHFEVYGADFTCAGGIDKGGVEKAVQYAEKGGAEIIKVYP